MNYLLFVVEGRTSIDDDLAYVLPMDKTQLTELVLSVQVADEAQLALPILKELVLEDREGEWYVVDVDAGDPYPRSILTESLNHYMRIRRRPSGKPIFLRNGSKILVDPYEQRITFRCVHEDEVYDAKINTYTLLELLDMDGRTALVPLAPEEPKIMEVAHGT